MAAGMARKYREQHGRQVAIVDHMGRIRHHDIWDRNPDIATELKPDTIRLLNCGGHRPYIASKNPTRWLWKRFKPTPAQLVLAGTELEFGQRHGGKILIEPNLKDKASPNKDWGFLNYQELVQRFPPGTFVQVGHGDFRRLAGVEVVPTHTFRLAAAVLAASRAYVGPEGGLHHAAAALGKPAVVIFGGFISPDQTGYTGIRHHNIFTGVNPCGMRVPCAHCRKAMDEITVDLVDRNLKELLNGNS